MFLCFVLITVFLIALMRFEGDDSTKSILTLLYVLIVTIFCFAASVATTVSLLVKRIEKNISKTEQ